MFVNTKKAGTLLLALVFTALVMLSSLTVVYATPSQGKQNICHATSSIKNPWEAINIADDNRNHNNHVNDFDYDGPLNNQGKPVQRDGIGDAWCASHSVTPAAVSFVDPICGVDNMPAVGSGKIVIPATTGVEYFVDGTLKSGTVSGYNGGDKVTVTAKAQTGYVLAAPYSESHTFTAPKCEQEVTAVTPKKPKFTDTCDGYGLVKIPKLEGVYYEINGEKVKAGTYEYKTGTFVKVKAFAKEGYVIEEGAKDTWKHTFVAPEDCDVETPAEPKFVPATCDALGTYTIPTSEMFEYYVNDSELPTDPGTYEAENGSTVTIAAYLIEADDMPTFLSTVQNETEREPAEVWDYTFDAPENCDATVVTPGVVETPVAETTATPTALPETGSAENIAVAAVSTVAGLIAMLSVAFKSAFIKLS